MPKAQRRKNSSFESNPVKSVFLYGHPNKEKAFLLEKMQSEFLSLTNEYIHTLSKRSDITLQLIKNDKKDGTIRQLEKQLRPKGINSAFSQNAFDIAITHLSNRLDFIRLDIHAENQTLFTQSKVLFVMSIDGKSKNEMIKAMQDIADIKKENNEFYLESVQTLTNMKDTNFDLAMKEFQNAYTTHSLEFKIPELKSIQVPLDCRLMKLEESDHVKAPYVISITNPFCKNKRFDIPLDISKHSLHKIKSHLDNMASTVMASIKDGVLKVAWSYTQPMKQPKTVNLIGVDTGIIDAFHTSDNCAIGSMKKVLDFYHNEVEPSFGELSSLRNKKRSIQHYLHKHPNLPADVRRSLLPYKTGPAGTCSRHLCTNRSERCVSTAGHMNYHRLNAACPYCSVWMGRICCI